MLRAKASVRTVPAWGERKAVGSAAGRATPVRPMRGTGQTGAGLDWQQFGVRARTGARFGSRGRGSVGWAGEFAGGSLLGVFPLVLNTGIGGSIALRWRGGTVHMLSFVVLVLLQGERVGSLMLVTVVEFVEVALVGKMVWFVLTPLSSKWLGTGVVWTSLGPLPRRVPGLTTRWAPGTTRLVPHGT
jgi:hypothetical protein